MNFIRRVPGHLHHQFGIDLSKFAESRPVFGYVDDGNAGMRVVRGLTAGGTMTITGQPPFLWLDGPRQVSLFQVSEEGKQDRRAEFVTLGCGEFCLEVYHLAPDGSIRLIFQDDFCSK